ncbi:MAG TPA: sulfite exporter TauE/SafE family protein [Burkholderiales bacterium]
MDWAYSLAGLIVGFIVGLSGMGGGSLMTPLLVLLFGIPPATAVGTDLLYASITKAGGVWVHQRRGNLDWRLVGWLAAGSIPTAVVTVLALAALGIEEDDLEALVSAVLGGALMLTAVALLLRDRLQQLSERGSAGDRPASTRRTAHLTLATGAALGVLVTISSVGAGVLGMAALLWLYPRLPSVKLVGTDIAHAVPLTAVAGLGHFYLGSVDLALLGYLLLGSLPGIYLGSQLSSRFPERLLRPALAGMLIVVGGRLVW